MVSIIETAMLLHNFCKDMDGMDSTDYCNRDEIEEMHELARAWISNRTNAGQCSRRRERELSSVHDWVIADIESQGLVRPKF
eukprot:IDg626t1